MIYHALPTVTLSENSDYIHTCDLPEVVHLDDPAVDVMMDFNQCKALTIGPDNPIVEARQVMTTCQFYVLLVTDFTDKVIGLISTEDILGEKPVKIIQEKHIRRSDVQVKMVMTPRDKIPAIPKEELKNAEVGHIIQTLQACKKHYALMVATTSTGQQSIQGIFSLTQISKQLAINISPGDLYATSLAELKKRFQ